MVARTGSGTSNPTRYVTSNSPSTLSGPFPRLPNGSDHSQHLHGAVGEEEVGYRTPGVEHNARYRVGAEYYLPPLSYSFTSDLNTCYVPNTLPQSQKPRSYNPRFAGKQETKGKTVLCKLRGG